jgi:two-component system, OmpR family, sensor histidine kinase VanS
MNATGSQLAPSAASPAPSRHRGALAYLLHALNQPLTGLQCSLELAVAGPRRPEQYVRTLHESLELTLRMRLLVEAIRELTDDQDENAHRETDLRKGDPPKSDRRENENAVETLPLDMLLRESADDLLPVAASRDVRLVIALEASLPVRRERRPLVQLLFRLLESILTLTRSGGELRITARREGEQAVLDLLWSEAPAPPFSPFSRAELGLLVARASWENIGGEWASTPAGNRQLGCTMHLPLASRTPEPARG